MTDSKIVVPGHIPTHLIDGGTKDKVKIPKELLDKFPGHAHEFLTPLHDYVLVEQKPLTIEVDSKVIVPGDAAEVNYEGNVIKVGPLVTVVKPGDYVAWMIGAGHDRPHMASSKNLKLIKQEQILAIIDNVARKAFLTEAKKADIAREAAAGSNLAAQRADLVQGSSSSSSER